jgi:cyclopropane fatty-acyl-phospholipid synthase-like methyltransferase
MSSVTEKRSFVPALRFPALTAIYDPVIRATTREETWKDRLVEGLDLEPGRQVLDLACGTGTLAVKIAERNPGVGVIGVDGDPEILRRARAKAKEAGVPVAFDEALSTELPYESQTFDRVTATLFFHHLTTRDKARTLAEVRRVLRPGGELHVADWTRPSDPVMRALFLPVRLLDGFEVTRVNVRGELPGMFERAGLGVTTEHDRLRTGFGSLALWTARVPR